MPFCGDSLWRFLFFGKLTLHRIRKWQNFLLCRKSQSILSRFSYFINREHSFPQTCFPKHKVSLIWLSKQTQIESNYFVVVFRGEASGAQCKPGQVSQKKSFGANGAKNWIFVFGTMIMRVMHILFPSRCCQMDVSLKMVVLSCIIIELTAAEARKWQIENSTKSVGRRRVFFILHWPTRKFHL